MNERNQFLLNLRLRLLKDEVTIMKQCKSPHVIKCIETIRTTDHEIMVLEFCRDGDLMNYIGKMGKLRE